MELIGANLRGIEKSSIIKAVVFSVFVDESGPTPIFCYPPTIDQPNQMNIAMKSISLLMGEGVYQSGFDYENLKYFGILPFLDINMVGITYFFLIKDEKARGKAKASTISVLVNEEDSNYLYENFKTLRILMDQVSVKLNADNSSNQIKQIMNNFLDQLDNFNVRDISINKITKKIKMVFTGLDSSGKTSFLKSIENKYSELMGIAPTKGIERTEKDLLGTSLVEWDFGGQENYRINYFKNAEFYLSDIDTLFYIVDIQDKNRVEESHSYIHQILTTLDSFKQYPPIIIVFHKYDSDIRNNLEIEQRIKDYETHIKKLYSKWIIRFFRTTIFDHWSIVSTFSYAISQLSPNREIFREHLKWIVKKMEGSAALLITRNSIVLSDYSENPATGKFFELSQPYFYNLFLNFEEFNMISNDFVLWYLKPHYFILKRFLIDGKEFYLMLQIGDRKVIEKMPENIEKFKEKIKPILQNFI